LGTRPAALSSRTHFAKPDLRALPDDEIKTLFASARSKVQASIAQVLKCCEAAIFIERGQLSVGRAIYESIDPNVDDMSPTSQNFIPAIRPNMNATLLWLERAEQGHKVTLGV
jgi:hypothetical protein